MLNLYINQMGFEATPINESFAVALSELVESGLTGAVVTYGAGLCNFSIIHEAGNFNKWLNRFTKVRDMLDCLFDKPFCILLGLIDSDQRWIGCLAPFEIAPGIFSQNTGFAENIKDIINYLKSNSDLSSKRAELVY